MSDPMSGHLRFAPPRARIDEFHEAGPAGRGPRLAAATIDVALSLALPWVASRVMRQCLHDRLADTIVVRA